MKPPRITDIEIAQMYQAGATYHAIPASTYRITRALNRHGVPRRRVGTTATSGDWIAEVAAITGGAQHPEPPPVYRGTSRLFGKLNARILQEREATA